MPRLARFAAGFVGAALAATGLGACKGGPTTPTVTLPPPHAGFDYQLGGAGPVPGGVKVVARQWSAAPSAGRYSICYVNAFQTEAEADDPDGPRGWPAAVVRLDLEDPDWPGEHPIDLTTAAKRDLAVAHVQRRLATCATAGFAAVEFDNLDAYQRYAAAGFRKADTITYARRLANAAHARGLAVGQKNTVELLGDARSIGFDFAVAEECGTYGECGRYTATYGGRVYDIEYTDAGLRAACTAIGTTASVVRRDLGLSPAGAAGHRYATC